jgi:ADP-heptose:LPS heptosyltransferase
MGHPDGVLDDVALRVGRYLLAEDTPYDFEEEDLLSVLEQATMGSREEMLVGSRRLFRDVVEPLADRFEPRLSERYGNFFTALIARLHGRPEFKRFHDRLAQSFDPEIFGLVPPEEYRRCVVLSRVTLGADVAVTSVVLDGLKRAYPDASLALACGAKAAALFQGDDRISFLPVEYARSGTLLERLNAWVDLSEQIEEWAGDELGECLVVSPDSRLTQLGLLPPAPAGGHGQIFDSRAFGGTGTESISELTSRWVDRMFEVEGAKPFVALSEADLAAGRELRGDSDRPMATLNWGFGGNDSKRVSPEFETAIVLELLRRGWRVVLDKGFGEVESGAAMATAKAASDADLHGLSLYEGSLSGFAGVIAASDLFVGYDSGAGHIAAALGVPGIDVFRGAVSERMRQRWSPWGEKPAQVVDVPAEESAERTLERVLELLP